MLMATAVAAANPELEEGAPDWVEITQEDARDIRMMVREQLAAFRGGDATRAWTLCSRSIHLAFERPEKLMDLIRSRYQALIGPVGLSFGPWTLTPEGLGLMLDVRSAEGDVHRALVLVVKERGVGWRINGALLVGGPEEALAEAA
jgi:hypothetical protein